MKIIELRCYIDGKRKLTNKLTKKQAKYVLATAHHLSSFLKKGYKLK